MFVVGTAASLAALPAATDARERPAESAVRMAGYGMEATLPPEWHGRVTRGLLEAATVRLSSVGTFPAGALGPHDLDAVLFEDAPSPGQPLNAHVYAAGPPRPFTGASLGRPRSAGRIRGGFASPGATSASTAACSTSSPPRVAPDRQAPRWSGSTASFRSLRIRPGDYYPGTVAPARFVEAPDWFTMASPRVPVGPETLATTVAATVPYRDALNAFPPHATLAALPADGVIVYLSLDAANRFPPLPPPRVRAPRRVHLRAPARSCGSFEGAGPSFGVCPLHALVPRRYTIDGWVVYGRRAPTRAQRARAQAELDRLVLPRWPLWPLLRDVR